MLEIKDDKLLWMCIEVCFEFIKGLADFFTIQAMDKVKLIVFLIDSDSQVEVSSKQRKVTGGRCTTRKVLGTHIGVNINSSHLMPFLS